MASSSSGETVSSFQDLLPACGFCPSVFESQKLAANEFVFRASCSAWARGHKTIARETRSPFRYGGGDRQATISFWRSKEAFGREYVIWGLVTDVSRHYILGRTISTMPLSLCFHLNNNRISSTQRDCGLEFGFVLLISPRKLNKGPQLTDRSPRGLHGMVCKEAVGMTPEFVGGKQCRTEHVHGYRFSSCSRLA